MDKTNASRSNTTLFHRENVEGREGDDDTFVWIEMLDPQGPKLYRNVANLISPTRRRSFTLQTTLGVFVEERTGARLNTRHSR